jgi:predicted nucleic acid-binding protein
LSALFVDTSALAKRYVQEIGSVWLRQQVRVSSQNRIVVAELLRVEMLSLFARHRRLNTMQATTVSSIRNTFLKHYRSQYWVVHIDQPILRLAGRLVEQHPLRTLDAIQLACALKAIALPQPMTFISADTNLLAAAAAEGFATDNPNNHP